MKNIKTYRKIYTIEQVAKVFVIRRKGEYVDTVSELWLAAKRIDQIVTGY